MATLSGQLKEKITSFGNGTLFTSHSVRKSHFPGVNTNSIHSGISALVRQGHVERTDKVDDQGYRQYRVLNNVTNINNSFKTHGHAGLKNLMKYKEQLRSRPLVDVLISIENQMKNMNIRLGDALTQESSVSAGKALEAYTIKELLDEVNRKTSAN